MDYLIFAIISYLLGSIPSALIVGKSIYNIDVRQHGSGNLGATNAFRVLGVKAGSIVTIADILKGTVATIIPILLAAEVYPLLIGLFAVLGHTYPIFAKFKGGKAVATSGGIILAVSPLLFLIVIATFIITLYISKYVSLSSMVTGLVSVLMAFLLQEEIGLIVIMSVLAIFVLYRHSENIKRIKDKTEPKIKWM
ncbi:glycerol-3-phosphate 1-O-acyltransferase PlsY [Virgibacillus byunsanensis]|uniref:Glycerol-3-phosphate acyltransferase n=1 Tax=Virgibacillus byunsanensis TaxID=570945 RepID=A0ABW3LHK3_9BACI